MERRKRIGGYVMILRTAIFSQGVSKCAAFISIENFQPFRYGLSKKGLRLLIVVDKSTNPKTYGGGFSILISLYGLHLIAATSTVE